MGHSLGAAAASLLAIILKPKFPNLHCFAFSPPGCVIKYCSLYCDHSIIIIVYVIHPSIDAVPYSRSFITSVVVGNDIVPRLVFMHNIMAIITSDYQSLQVAYGEL